MSHFNEHTLEMAIMELFEQKTASEQAEKRDGGFAYEKYIMYICRIIMIDFIMCDVRT